MAAVRAINEKYFTDVVDPVMRPLMLILQENKPSKTELPIFIIEYFKNIEKKYQYEEEKVALASEIEMDSKSSETILDLKALLLPPKFEPLSSFNMISDHFSISYSRRALEAWVKQPSPCCAAASAAGAWNAAMGLTRTDPRAQSHLTMIPVFSRLLQEQADAIQGRFERLLGAPLQPLLELVVTRLAEDGRCLGGKGEAVASRKLILKLIKRIVADELKDRVTLMKDEAKENDEGKKCIEESLYGGDGGGDVFDRLGELIEEERLKKEELVIPQEVDIGDEDLIDCENEEEGEGECEGNEGNKHVEQDVGSTEVDEEEEDEELISDIPIKKKKVTKKTSSKKTSKKKKSSSSKSHGEWAWKKELLDWFRKLGGLEKINAERASTAPFGNWGVIGALRTLNDQMGSDVDVVGSLLMGKKSKASSAASTSFAISRGIPPYISLSRDDDENTITKQWNGLRSAFHLPDSCLLFHLKNHYALIFAMREWEEPINDVGVVNNNNDEKKVDESKAAEEPSEFKDTECKDNDDGGGGEYKTNDSATFSSTRQHRIVRQILTSRRGQRPSAWIDFSEARETMLNWEGYKIMIISRLS